MIDGWQQIIAGVIFIGFITVFLIKLSKRSLHHDLRARDITKGHHWCYTGMFSQPSYCNICETLIMASNGVFCGACGVCADQPDCITSANSLLQCKKISMSDSNLKHHWIKGNLPLGALCEVCDEECGMEMGLSDLRCCWCQGCCHVNCIEKLSEICDLGQLKKFVVPPNHVILYSGRIRKQLIILQVSPPDIENWSPIIVIGNSSSGSNEAEYYLSSFRKVLNPAQVFDISTKSPEEALEWCHLIPDATFKVIVAGGDGTVAWVLDTIYKMRLKTSPYICILPLGTGNDLSRVLGWGDSHSGLLNVSEFLQKINVATLTEIDRWKVHFTPPKIFGGIHPPSKPIYMSNYLSIGVDALVALNFHRARQSPFYIFNSRIMNKFIYFSYGTKDVLLPECRNLEERIELWMDGCKVDLPEFEALVVLNIASWGAGVIPWTMGQGGENAPKQSFNDQKLEVFCVSSSFHIAQLQIGMTEPIRIGQCSSLQILLKDSTAPMQVDGEPWEQPVGRISVKFSHSAKVLFNDQ